MLTRRTVLAAAFPAIVGATAKNPLPIGFSTLGCPKWTWDTILKNAQASGYTGIELRGILDQMDLTKVPEFTGTRLAGTMKDVAALGLKISDLGASAAMHEPDTTKLAKHMDEAKRFIDLAHAMKSPYVRVFPNQLVKGEDQKVTIARMIQNLAVLGAYAKAAGVTVIVESHGEFTNKDLLTPLMTAHKNVAFLWDTHHTIVAGEQAEVTWKALGKYTRHLHLKDSVPEGSGRKYVLTGEGKIPVRDTVQMIARKGYKGYYCYEWEKRWHPELAEPEVAFPHFAKTMREYLNSA